MVTKTITYQTRLLQQINEVSRGETSFSFKTIYESLLSRNLYSPLNVLSLLSVVDSTLLVGLEDDRNAI